MKPFWLQIIALIVLVFITVDANLQLPDYMAKIINQGIVSQNNSEIWHNGLIMLAISLAGAVATIAVGFFASKIATGFAMNVRNKVFANVESFSLNEFNKFSTASLITRSTNDIQQVQMVMVMLLRMVLQAPLTGGWAVIKAYRLAPNMSWIMALAVSILIVIIAVLFSLALPKFQLLQKLVDKLNLVTRQNLTGLRVIRAFNNEKLEEGKFEKANQELTNANLYVNRLMVVMQPFMTLIFSFTSIAVVWFGSHYISSGNLAIGDMIAFMQYSMQVIMSFLMISIIFIMVPRASVSAKRVAEVLDTKPIITDPQDPEKASDTSGTVEFRNVTFCYQGADTPVLKDINFTAEPGQTTAIIGSTGSGKTTLVNLIPRFYDVSSGEVLVDGLDVRKLKLMDLYSKIGYVPQKAVLFSGTVESNIKYGAPDASPEKMDEAARISHSQEFIDKLPEQFKSPISQGGTNVSGGQKQRLSIARAIARDPEIYIFDDSFSALDFKTDAKVRQALAKETVKKTVIVVAQRIATVLNADKIIVLDEGEVVGQGKHEELMKNCEVYREIAGSQLSEDELRVYGQKIVVSETGGTK